MAKPVGKPKLGTEVAVKKARIAVAAAGNPWSQLALELEKHLGAPVLKFTKQGEFALSETDFIPEGTKVVARVDLIETGWVRWVDGMKEKTVMGPVADKFVPPARATLGDTDPRNWSDPDRDPWQFQMVMPITRCDTDETFKFTSGSKGGMNAVNKLIRVFGTRTGRGETGLPVCALKAGSYKHHEFGKIFFPVFEIATWTGDGGKPMTVEQDLNDEIPI
jgi:hypothetical protein